MSRLLLGLVLLGLAGPARGLEDRYWRDVERRRGSDFVQAYAALLSKYEWDSNIARSGAGPLRDSLVVFSPILAARLRGGSGSFVEGSYRLDTERFFNKSSYNALGHDIDFRTRYAGSAGFLQASNHYVDTNERAATVLTGRVERRENTWAVGTGTEYKDIRLALDYDRFRVNYRGAPSIPNYSRGALRARSSLVMGSHYIGRLLVDWERYRYDNLSARDGDVWQTRLGWDYFPGERLNMGFDAGMQTRRYRGAGRADYTGFVGALRTAYTERGKGFVAIAFRTSAMESPVEPPNTFYRDNSLSFEAELEPMHRYRIRFGNILSRQTYPTGITRGGFSGHRRDIFYMTELTGFHRPIENIELSLGVSREERGSNIGTERYRAWVISAGCRLEI